MRPASALFQELSPSSWALESLGQDRDVGRGWGEVVSSTGGSVGRSKSEASLEGEKALGTGCNLWKRVASRGPHPSWKTRRAGYQRTRRPSSP